MPDNLERITAKAPIVAFNPPSLGLDDLNRWAKIFIASGIFKGEGDQQRQMAQAIIKIQYGQELGIPPYAAMDGIDVIDGRPAPNAGLTAALIKRTQRYDFSIITSTNNECVLEWVDGERIIGTSEFNYDDAEAAQLLTKANWRKYPSDMYFARALTRGARRFLPHIFLGSVYTAEELGGDDEPAAELHPDPRPGAGRKAIEWVSAEDAQVEVPITVDVEPPPPEPVTGTDPGEWLDMVLGAEGYIQLGHLYQAVLSLPEELRQDAYRELHEESANRLSVDVPTADSAAKVLDLLSWGKARLPAHIFDPINIIGQETITALGGDEPDSLSAFKTELDGAATFPELNEILSRGNRALSGQDPALSRALAAHYQGKAAALRAMAPPPTKRKTAARS